MGFTHCETVTLVLNVFGKLESSRKEERVYYYRKNIVLVKHMHALLKMKCTEAIESVGGISMNHIQLFRHAYVYP